MLLGKMLLGKMWLGKLWLVKMCLVKMWLGKMLLGKLWLVKMSLSKMWQAKPNEAKCSWADYIYTMKTTLGLSFEFWSLLNKLVKNQSLNKTVFFVVLILSPTTEVNCVFRINELCIASKSLDEPFKEDEQHVVINFQMEPKLIRLN